MKHGKLVASLFIILTVSGIVTYLVDPSLFENIRLPGQNTIATISQINVDPQGQPIGDEWHGSYWNINAYVTVNDDLVGVVLPKNQTASVSYNGALEALQSGAKVEVKIDPQTPYLIRDVQEKQVMVAPGAVGTVGSASSPVYQRYYDWAEPTWRIYTPFVVTVFKDGQQIGQATLNMQGQNQVQTVSTSEGAVRIENLGILGGQYLSPNTPSQIAILKGMPNVYDWNQIYDRIDGSTAGTIAGANANKYGDYWFGVKRDASNRAINQVIVLGTQMTVLYPPSTYGGWVASGSGGSVSALAPPITSSDKSSLPADKRSFLSLTEWLDSRGVANLAASIFNTRSSGNSGALWQDSSFITDSNGQTALKLTVPWSAFGTPLVNIRIPTELADTFIDRPIVTGTQLSAVWQTNGAATADIMGGLRIAVTVTNTGTVTGSTRLTVTSGNSKLALTPVEMTVNNLEPNTPQTVYFDATNLGVEDQINSIPITISAHDTYTGAETGRTTLYGTLLATLQTGTTTLKLHVVEKNTDNLVKGLQLSITYGGQQKTAFTNAIGDVELTLATPQGGAFTGELYVQSADTTVYKTASATYTLANPTAYEKTLEVERKDIVYPVSFDWNLVFLIVGIVAVAAIVGGIAYKIKKNRR